MKVVAISNYQSICNDVDTKGTWRKKKATKSSADVLKVPEVSNAVLNIQTCTILFDETIGLSLCIFTANHIQIFDTKCNSCPLKVIGSCNHNHKQTVHKNNLKWTHFEICKFTVYVKSNTFGHIWIPKMLTCGLKMLKRRAFSLSLFIESE